MAMMNLLHREHVRDGYNINEIQDKLRSAVSLRSSSLPIRNAGKISWRLSTKYPIVMLGKTKLFFIILRYYIIAYPISFVLNYLDTYSRHSTHGCCESVEGLTGLVVEVKGQGSKVSAS